ncbi:hypothetical protein P8452_47440 [Trifolium repens]|nr:hypothetical protein QL285_075973 [Trifolium repens]WJX62444.1 hypothetical protein P8452_47440 [Trifolium repens]
MVALEELEAEVGVAKVESLEEAEVLDEVEVDLSRLCLSLHSGKINLHLNLYPVCMRLKVKLGVKLKQGVSFNLN